MVSNRYGESLRYPLTRHSCQGGSVQVYANLPLPLAAALDVEPGETVTWKVLDRTHLLLVRLPERKKLKGQAVPRLQARKKARRAQEHKP